MSKTHLIADYLVLLDIIERWYRETSCVAWINVEIDVSKMGEVFVYWVRCDIFSWNILLWGCKAPSL